MNKKTTICYLEETCFQIKEIYRLKISGFLKNTYENNLTWYNHFGKLSVL